MFLILSGIIAEFTEVQAKRHLLRNIHDLAQFVGGDSQHAVPPAPSEHPLKMMLYNRAQSERNDLLAYITRIYPHYQMRRPPCYKWIEPVMQKLVANASHWLS